MSDVKPSDLAKANLISIQSKVLKKKPVKNWQFLTNLIEEWYGTNKVIRYNMFTHLLEVAKRLPWDDEEFDATTSEPYPEDSWVYHRNWGMVDTGYVRRKIDEKYPKLNFPETSVIAAIEFVATTNIYNPIKDHLQALQEWDGEPRLDTWLFDICNASGPSREIISLIGKKFILGMVKRGYFPGTKFDNILILEGKQGIGKSTLVRALAGNDHLFSDDIISDLTDSRQIIEKYAGKFLVEIGELGTFSKADQKLLKRFVVAQYDTGRPAFARYVVSIPRSFSFIGTVNDARYFEDETGLRRYWPIRVSNIDIDRLTGIYRDQLLAEAIHYLDLEKHYFYGDEELALEREYEEFKKCKLRSSNDKLLFWIIKKWDDLIHNRETDRMGRELVNGNWLYEFCISNFEGNFSSKQYTLVLQMLGCSQVKKMNGNYWQVPDSPVAYDV